MEFILRAKHWQLFAILFFPGFIPTISPLVDSIIGISLFTVLLSWLWGIGVTLNDRYDFTLSNGSFKAAFIFFACYMIAILLPVDFFKIDINKFKWILVPHILAIICLLYCFLFSARTLKAIETNGEVSSSDCWGHFFLLFCFPIGIWILQPKINQMFEGAYSRPRKISPDEVYKPNPAIRRMVNFFIVIGGVSFVSGLALGNLISNYFKILIPLGTASAVCGSILFLFVTNLKREFEYPGEDSLKYFWDKIVLKFWAFALLLWMFLVNREMFF